MDFAELVSTSTYCSMLHLTQQLTRELAPGLEQHDLSPVGYMVLGQALVTPGTTPAQMARQCGLSPQHISLVLDREEQRGRIRRLGRRGRGRPTGVQLTDQGRAALEAGWPVIQAVGRDQLSPTQHRMLQALVERLRDQPRTAEDVVVLVDDHDTPLGTQDRVRVHHAGTPLHRAFSTHLRRPDGKVLLTRRALHKATWPGVWTNSACGHLRPGESAEQAAMRRVPQELGTAPDGLRMRLPAFRYRATDASGVVENELCPVMVGSIDPERLSPDPDEVCDLAWVDWRDLRQQARTMPATLSPWCVLQVEALGDDPWGQA